MLLYLKPTGLLVAVVNIPVRLEVTENLVQGGDVSGRLMDDRGRVFVALRSEDQAPTGRGSSAQAVILQ